jgi:hypothetical protein
MAERSLDVLRPRMLARAVRAWRMRMRTLAPTRLMLRAPGPAMRRHGNAYGRRDGWTRAHRGTLRAWPRPVVLRERTRTLVRERVDRPAAAPPPPRLVERLLERVVTPPSPRGRCEPAAASALRPAGVLRDLRRIERAIVRRERERTRIERGLTPAPTAGHIDPLATSVLERAERAPSMQALHPLPTAPGSRSAGLPEPPTAWPTRPGHPAPTQASEAPPAPVDVQELAERVLRLIERRAHAQRERLGMA